MDKLFRVGLDAYQQGNFFNAHEHWEKLWSNYHAEDRRFIQGLIQLSVSLVHLQNNNLSAARGLMKKCLEKFEDFSGIQREINVDILKLKLLAVQEEYSRIQECKEFNWALIPALK